MRAFLLVAVFLDQLMHSRFQSLHEAFYQEFSVPKLLARGGSGCATPDLLLEHRQALDNDFDWHFVEELASGAFVEVYDWIHARRPIKQDEFVAILREEIIAVFDRKHRDKLVDTFLRNQKYEILPYQPPCVSPAGAGSPM